jgi:hypothetical protein
MRVATAPALDAAAAADGIDDDAVGPAIRRLLDGDNDGYAVFDALYGATLDEPLPARLIALVRRR